MTIQYIPLPLFSDSSYSYTIGLEGQNYKFQMLWNERAATWFFSIYLEDNTPLVLGERLVPNYPVLEQYPLTNLTGYLALIPKSDINQEQYLSAPRQLDQYHSLYYVYNDGL